MSTGKTFGPYEVEQDTYSEPMPQQVRRMHEIPGYIRPGDPDRRVRTAVYGALIGVCKTSGVELGTYDREILAWLAGFESSAAQVVVGLVARAYATGKRGGSGA